MIEGESMLDREVVREFLDEELDDYYEWLKDNFKTFFDYGNPDWQWVKRKN